MSSAAEWNKRRWSQSDLPDKYPAKSPLFAAEDHILEVLRDRISTARLLDIGVGAGRTTAHLAPRVATYIGIDYSEEMVKSARSSFPTLDIRHMDARDLAAFADETFDIVWFSYNGIDYVSHEDRLLILRQIHRVVAPDGYFVMSSHNRDFAILAETRNPVRQPIRRTPLAAAKDTARILLSSLNALRLRGRESQCDEYAIVNDLSHANSLLTYYISLPRQCRQLQQAGFQTTRAFAMDGKELPCDAVHRADYMVHYLASKV